jgi:anti-anti-sigma factor
MLLRVQVRQGDQVVEDRLIRSETVTFGRSEDASVRLDGRHVSRIHLVLEWIGKSWWAEDRSSNGTWLDGERLSGRTRLARPCTLTIDTFSIDLTPGGSAAPAEATADGSERPEAIRTKLPEGKFVEVQVQGGLLQGEVVRFSELPVEIGRDHHCDLVLPEGFVSRRHVRIWAEEDEIYVGNISDGNTLIVDGRVVPNGGSVLFDHGATMNLRRLVLKGRLGGPAREQTADRAEDLAEVTGTGGESAPDPDATAIRMEPSPTRSDIERKSPAADGGAGGDGAPDEEGAKPVQRTPGKAAARVRRGTSTRLGISVAPSIAARKLLVLRLTGILDLVTVARLEEQVRSAFTEGWKFIAVDFEKLERLDSSALSSVVKFLVELEKAGRKIRIFSVSSAVQEILLLANVEEFFADYFCRDEKETIDRLGLSPGQLQR